MSRASGLGLDVRPYRPDDEPRVLELLAAALGGGPTGERSPDFFRWKHLANPFGSSVMLVAEAEDQIIGFRSLMRWRFQAGEGTVAAVRPVDTATHPEYQGRGVFSRLTRAALDSIREEVDLVFNTPNEKSLPGYLKMGWHVVGNIPVWVRLRKPIRFARGMRSRGESVEAFGNRPPIQAETAAEALGESGEVGSLLERAEVGGSRLRTPRDHAYLHWRYAQAPMLDYRAVREYREGRLCGLAFFRVRSRGRLWESTVTEVIVEPNDARTTHRLLRRAAKAAPVDHLTCHFSPDSARVALRSGFLRSPEGMTFVVNPVRESIDPDPSALRSWALSLGDVEVF